MLHPACGFCEHQVHFSGFRAQALIYQFVAGLRCGHCIEQALEQADEAINACSDLLVVAVGLSGLVHQRATTTLEQAVCIGLGISLPV